MDNKVRLWPLLVKWLKSNRKEKEASSEASIVLTKSEIVRKGLGVKPVNNITPSEKEVNMVYWTTSDGDKIPIDEMDDLHVFNSVRLIYKKYGLSFRDMPRMLDEARNFLEDTVTGRNKTQLMIARQNNPWAH